MRDGNLILNSRDIGILHVFELPMRDGNINEKDI